MNGGYPLRPVASARTRLVAGIAAQPGGCQRPRPAPSPRQSAGFGPPIYRLRQFALEVSHRAQYRLCPVVVGLRQTRQRLPGALRARQCGPCPAFSPVSSWVPAVPRTGRSRQCDGRRVKPLRLIRVMAMPVSWDITVERAGRFKFAAPALRLLAFWVERRVVPPAPHVNMTMFEDCSLAGETSHGQACGPVEDLNRGHA
jgi:hypothetical protein